MLLKNLENVRYLINDRASYNQMHLGIYTFLLLSIIKK